MARCILRYNRSTGAARAHRHHSLYLRNDNLSIYKAFDHQHLKEIGESIKQLQPGYGRTINLYHIVGLHPWHHCQYYMDSDLSGDEL